MVESCYLCSHTAKIFIVDIILNMKWSAWLREESIFCLLVCEKFSVETKLTDHLFPIHYCEVSLSFKNASMPAMWLLFPLSVFALIITPNFADRKLRYREFNSLPDVTYSESDQFRLQQIFLTLRRVLFKWLYFKKYLKCPNGKIILHVELILHSLLMSVDIVALMPRYNDSSTTNCFWVQRMRFYQYSQRSPF